MDNLVRENIKGLTPYVPNNYNYKYKLDANESPYQLSEKIINQCVEEMKKLELNRYPDSNAERLIREIGKYVDIDPRQIIVGNGSNQLINLIIDTFVDSGDTVVSHNPTFSMYSLACKTAGADYIGVDSDENFNIQIDEIIEQANQERAKVIFLCTPNNPTGNVIPKEEIIKVLKGTESIVVVDEAYIEFGGESIVKEIEGYDRLIVLRTLSKALGLAGIRLGYLVGSLKAIGYMSRVKSPYNINSITQIVAKKTLENREEILKRVYEIKANRGKMLDELKKINGIEGYPSEANFILFKVTGGRSIIKSGDEIGSQKNSETVCGGKSESIGKFESKVKGNGNCESKIVFDELLKKGILVRHFKKEILEGCIRVTISKEEENKAFIKELKEVIGE